METLGNTSQWSGEDTKDLCFYLEIEFGAIFTFIKNKAIRIFGVLLIIHCQGSGSTYSQIPLWILLLKYHPYSPTC